MKAIFQVLASAVSPLAFLLCWGFCSVALGETSEAVKPVYTNNMRFRIPFRYDADELQRIGAKEIRLYLSEDQGKNWELSRQAHPQAGKFDFQAPAEGEYWFSVRTLDGQNQLYPRTQKMTPGLKVIVDTTPPSLAIELAQSKPGKVKMTWKGSDPNLDISTLRLEYIQAGAERWEMVSVIPQAQGQTAWSVPQGGTVAVRGQIFDRAGNVQQAQSQVRLEAAPAVPNLEDPIATPGLNQSVVGMPLGALPPAVSHPFDESRGNAADTKRPAMEELISNHAETKSSRFPNAEAKPRLPKHTRVVNSRKFQIGYKVEDVGPSGVGEVELYITEDDGQKWYKYGNDPDRTSPFQVETPRDGTYGFALRVHSGAGLANDPPRPGEKPSIVVVVDKTPPQVRLLSADQGRGENQNKVVLRWSVSDDFPSETPIALSYTNDPNGVWEPISGWIEDSGEYIWNAGPNTPTRLFFRVTARDAAGNLNRAQTHAPVIVDLSRPSARIVDVESLNPEVVR